ncbi:PRTase-like protein [Mollisia scopiformis]|uniref:adenine phosphoribosyltransferase n=1 Tax=Mollisia scopiformis TaxID=149040 RepID=A0A194XMW4_MOLSC|nr:PRTase-like protein [Mollisia scopiformis]KUJ21117.1 PRTase-like protein [Mollisia scopiformis]
MTDPKDVALILEKLKLYIGHPNPGQPFADIFPIFRDPAVTEIVISHLVKHIQETHDLTKISAIVCLEARGFFFGPLIASRLSLPVVPVRKKGKLPGAVVSVTYDKDYGPDSFEMKDDAFEGIEKEGKQVLLVDDLLGMGGSVMAAKGLVEKLGQSVAELVFIFDVDIPIYAEAVKKNLGDAKRYAMVTLTTTNMGAPISLG